MTEAELLGFGVWVSLGDHCSAFRREEEDKSDWSWDEAGHDQGRSRPRCCCVTNTAKFRGAKQLFCSVPGVCGSEVHPEHVRDTCLCCMMSDVSSGKMKKLGLARSGGLQPSGRFPVWLSVEAGSFLGLRSGFWLSSGRSAGGLALGPGLPHSMAASGYLNFLCGA